MSLLAWPLLLLVLAILLLIAEVFLPSGGTIGLLALGCLAVSLWQAFQVSNRVGLAFLAADFALLPTSLAVGMYLWPKTPFAKRVFLKAPNPDEIGGSHERTSLERLVGQYGRALTPLRPSGSVECDGRRHDAIAESGFIAAGAAVVLIRVRAGQVVVRPTGDELPG